MFAKTKEEYVSAWKRHVKELDSLVFNLTGPEMDELKELQEKLNNLIENAGIEFEVAKRVSEAKKHYNSRAKELMDEIGE
jgi:hypothetical protein